ncbi:hypothetical protein NP603_14360 [Methylomonas sp. SURF-1]|uniref:DUF3168 domain-containing protein n=1 Tax=Methylomonas aurea TaxID=2952224 RepID=A0ABT1UKV4_9GAMM|nr:hypothetical protein [Methylomonas sp. SURF-1]MCQ8182300.1 hypothetical protein [Methylomonas sp. SURF-1]
MPDQRLPLPPFGKELIARLQSTSPPWPIMICFGRDAWQRARQWHCNPTVWALVCPSDSAPVQYRWPVLDLVLIVDWQQDRATGHDEVMALVKVLLGYGAESVTVLPSWVDFSQLAVEYDARLPVGERWVQVREEIVVYRLDVDRDD